MTLALLSATTGLVSADKFQIVDVIQGSKTERTCLKHAIIQLIESVLSLTLAVVCVCLVCTQLWVGWEMDVVEEDLPL